jgi:HEAT repeat protein
LAEPDANVRFLAARALGRLGRAGAPAQSALETALNDTDREVRAAVVDALNRIFPP